MPCNMKLNVAIVILSIILQVLGASISSKDGSVSTQISPLKYYPNMTTMWITDESGKMMEVYLTKTSQSNHSLSDFENKIFYFLYTRKHVEAYQILNGDWERLNSSTFDPTLPTKVLVHGFANTYQSTMEQLIREAYLNYQDVNIVGVDWGDLAKGPYYIDAVLHTQTVGQHVAQLIDFLVSAGANISDFHLIGHSLGAHVVSFASNKVTSGNITRITGLDPALPLFALRPASERLDPSDADLVDCIHTCGGYLGFYDPICSIDFYPNRGIAFQPGCSLDLTGACSHGRSYRYFSASIAQNFTAQSCSSLSEVKKGSCSGTTGFMGDLALLSQPGLYYLKTTSNYPYFSN